VFRIAPQDERAVFFMVGEQSGWICPGYAPKLENKHGCEFLEMALSHLRETCATASVTELTTPFNEMFCDEQSPSNPHHPFRKYCRQNNIVQKIATLVSTPVGFLQKGWPGVDAGRRTTRRSKSAPPRESSRV
jgi:hypothetical protein